MEYFQISRSAEPKIIGIKNGASQVKLETSQHVNSSNYILFNNFFDGFNKDFFQNQQQIDLLNPPIFAGKLKKKCKIN